MRAERNSISKSSLALHNLRGFTILMVVAVLTRPSRILAALAENAFGIYFFHFGFVLWLQYMLLSLPPASGIKFAIVSSGVLVLSWAAAAGVSRAAEAIGLLPGQLPGQPPAIRASTRAFARSNLWSSSG